MNDEKEAIESKIKEIDLLIAAQLDEIMHHPEFQALEAAWRGLHHLIHQSGESLTVRIRVLNATKRELLKDLERAVEFNQSCLFKKIHSDVYGVFAGEPFGLLVGAYEFDNSPQFISLLENLANVAAAAHAPFITAASPELFGCQSFAEAVNIDNLRTAVFEQVEYSKWNSLRSSQTSLYIGMCLPRILLRVPHNIQSDSFNYRESEETKDLLWGNAAFAFAACAARAYNEKSWLGTLHGENGDGFIEGLPSLTLDSGITQFSTDACLTDEQEAVMSKLGFLPLLQNRSTGESAFKNSYSLYQYQTDADGNAVYKCYPEWSKLVNVIAASRFVHYLLLIARDRSQLYRDRRDCESNLNRWASRYVREYNKPDAERPLIEARIDVNRFDPATNQFTAVFYVQPVYLLEEMGIAMRVVL